VCFFQWCSTRFYFVNAEIHVDVWPKQALQEM
jgi:hypothetical protein